MAIVKHKTSKNARYSDVLDYYTYKHEESQATGHYEPILDENGLMIERDDYAVTCITSKGVETAPEIWEISCNLTNMEFQKNMGEGDRKNHEYIIAHPAEDQMTVEQLLEEGKAFARENLRGYDCLIGAHDNHVHITINSVRALAREREEDWMMRDKNGQVLPCEMEAGGKHQDSPGLRRRMNDWLLEYTREHGYVQKDNNAIADVHRAERHGNKNEHMKAALLEAAGRSENMRDLQRIMKDDYDMDMKVSPTGSTISVLYPGNEKYVRLRTLELEPADLTRRFTGDEYKFTPEAEEQQKQKEFEAREQKRSIDWIRERRQRNNDRAERMVERSEEILEQEIRAKGQRYDKSEFQDLRYLIRETAYVSSNLQTEMDKLDKLLDRWNQYEDQSLTEKERWSHGAYVRFCGCDPDSSLELEDLRAEREIVEAQKELADELNKKLQEEAALWQGRNNLTYTMNNLAWTKQREKQLKMQLKRAKQSRKKLWEIYCNCERAAERSERYGFDVIHRTPQRRNANKFKAKWQQAVKRQKTIQKQLKEIKQQKKDAKAKVRQAKKNAKELDLKKVVPKGPTMNGR